MYVGLQFVHSSCLKDTGTSGTSEQSTPRSGACHGHDQCALRLPHVQYLPKSMGKQQQMPP